MGAVVLVLGRICYNVVLTGSNDSELDCGWCQMGLGKTAQSIAALEYQRQVFGTRGPFLVVAPLTTLGHWAREIVTWTGMVRVVWPSARVMCPVSAQKASSSLDNALHPLLRWHRSMQRHWHQSMKSCSAVCALIP